MPPHVLLSFPLWSEIEEAKITGEFVIVTFEAGDELAEPIPDLFALVAVIIPPLMVTIPSPLYPPPMPAPLLLLAVTTPPLITTPPAFPPQYPLPMPAPKSLHIAVTTPPLMVTSPNHPLAPPIAAPERLVDDIFPPLMVILPLMLKLPPIPAFLSCTSCIVRHPIWVPSD